MRSHPASVPDCKCEHNFTCGYCLRNAKPWHFTGNTGTKYAPGHVPVDLLPNYQGVKKP